MTVSFSPRQAEVCLLVVAGESPAEIATELGISVDTVDHHVRTAADKIRRVHPEFDVKSPRNLIRRFYVLTVGKDPFRSLIDGAAAELEDNDGT